MRDGVKVFLDWGNFVKTSRSTFHLNLFHSSSTVGASMTEREIFEHICDAPLTPETSPRRSEASSQTRSSSTILLKSPKTSPSTT